MKVTLEQVLAASIAIRHVETEKASIRFAYALAKNKAKMKADFDGIVAAENETHEIEAARIKYCREKAEKDKDGVPIIEGKAFKGVSENDPKIIEFLEKRGASIQAEADFLKGEVDIDFHMIDFKDVPEQIAPADLEALMVMITEPKEKK